VHSGFRMAPQIRWPFEEAGVDLAFLGVAAGKANGVEPEALRWN
jgi:hypothetical protein